MGGTGARATYAVSATELLMSCVMPAHVVVVTRVSLNLTHGFHAESCK